MRLYIDVIQILRAYELTEHSSCASVRSFAESALLKPGVSVFRFSMAWSQGGKLVRNSAIMLCVVEMMKAGLIEEMMDDVMDGVNQTEEEDVDVEVAKVLQEVAGEVVAELPAAGKTQIEAEKTDEVRSPVMQCHHASCATVFFRF
jgi:hypothetical protein